MSAIDQKKDIVILIAGFGAYSRETSNGIYYWGGKLDLQGELRSRGFNIHTAQISPFSSNWDRACELYAWLFGGIVDYGEVHSCKYGHKRFGRRFPGMVQRENGDRIHLIGHSLGGNTGRLFASLLYWGDKTEQACNSEKISPLFEGLKFTITSLNCLATPFRGTTAVFLPGSHQRIALRLVKILYDLNQLIGVNRDFYLDQWDFSTDEWISRIFPEEYQTLSLIGEDSAIADLIPALSEDYFKDRLDSPETIYNCWSASVKESIGGLPPGHARMNPVLLPFFRFIQSYNEPEGRNLSADNDGLVNTSSMIMPSSGAEIISIMPDSGFNRGKWNYRGHWQDFPHWELHGNFLRKARDPGLEGFLSDWFETLLVELSHYQEF